MAIVDRQLKYALVTDLAVCWETKLERETLSGTERKKEAKYKSECGSSGAITEALRTITGERAESSICSARCGGLRYFESH